MFGILRSLHIVFLSGWTSLHYHQQCMRVPEGKFLCRGSFFFSNNTATSIINLPQGSGPNHSRECVLSGVQCWFLLLSVWTFKQWLYPCWPRWMKVHFAEPVNNLSPASMATLFMSPWICWKRLTGIHIKEHRIYLIVKTPPQSSTLSLQPVWLACKQGRYEPFSEEVNPNEQSTKDKMFLMQLTLFFQFMTKSWLPCSPWVLWLTFEPW
jgi:hypothetical protein